jgi:xanthine dehydrogenase YagS FAD-binding subunit
MNPFAYSRTADPATAIKQVAGDAKASFVAGGTSLIDLMKLRVESPALLVDVNGLPLNKIEELQGLFRIGALVSNTDLAYHDGVRKRFPVLSEALLSGASPQLRNMASVGGNLMQRTRCYYFRDGIAPCNKREPGSGCAALEGYNRIHAVLGVSDQCIATHPSDMAVALVALEAVVKVRGPKGERSIKATDFHLLPDDHPERETALEHGELITGVELTQSPLAARSHYLKVRDRASYEFALASAAVALEITDGVIRAARLALGGVATKPWRAFDAEKALVGQKPTEALFIAAAQTALKDAKPHKDNGFKIELAQRTIIRALTVVEGMA